MLQALWSGLWRFKPQLLALKSKQNALITKRFALDWEHLALAAGKFAVA